ncbi:MAG: hypothetical protein JNK90_00225 [Planctomycetaceae bacterium]|nr:hypothetical protein [Planctomycetaceae bacterium]
MARRFAFALLAFGSLVSLPAACSAQDVLSELYGRGVHAYFAGDTTGALTFLNDADTAGSTDPRVFYFRGLVKASMGMTDEAVVDFDKGAGLEVSSKRAVEVGKALARIQGANRLQIEDARRKARLTAQANKAQILRDQYESVKKSDAEMVRPAASTPPVVETKPDVAANDPFANPEKMQDGAPTVDENKPATPAPAAEGDNPFGDDAPAKPAPAEDDPFGGSGGGAKPAEDDPFGGN